MVKKGDTVSLTLPIRTVQALVLLGVIPYGIRRCRNCSGRFVATDARQKFCSPDCGAKVRKERWERERRIAQNKAREKARDAKRYAPIDASAHAPIDSIVQLSERAKKCCRAAGISTIECLRGTPDSTLLKTKNLGRGTLRELRRLGAYKPSRFFGFDSKLEIYVSPLLAREPIASLQAGERGSRVDDPKA